MELTISSYEGPQPFPLPICVDSGSQPGLCSLPDTNEQKRRLIYHRNACVYSNVGREATYL